MGGENNQQGRNRPKLKLLGPISRKKSPRDTLSFANAIIIPQTSAELVSSVERSNACTTKVKAISLLAKDFKLKVSMPQGRNADGGTSQGPKTQTLLSPVDHRNLVIQMKLFDRIMEPCPAILPGF